MGIVVGATFRLRLLAACFFAVVLSGAWVFAAEEPAPAAEKSAVEAEKKDADDKKEKAGDESVPDLPAPTAEEIAKRDARADEYRTLGEKFFKFPVTGSLYTTYTLQRATKTEGSSGREHPDRPEPEYIRPKHDSEDDQDIHQYLTMDFGDPYKHIAVGHFDLQVDTDLDGYSRRRDFDHDGDQIGDVDRRDPFHSIRDTFGDNVYYRLDSAYVDFNRIPGVAKLRVGRQMTYETPAVAEFDGVRLDTQPFFGNRELVFSFYGGRAVHNYEITDSNVRQNELAQPNEGGALLNNGYYSQAHDTDSLILHDLVYGAAAEGRPWDGGRMRLDWQYLNDQLYDPFVLSNRSSSNQVTLNVWHNFNKPNVSVNARASLLDGKLKDTFARVLYYKEDWRLHVSATYQGYYYDQKPQYIFWDQEPNYWYPDPMANEIDPYSQVLGELQDYHQASLVVNKDWTDNFSTEFGVAFRRIADRPDDAYSHYDAFSPFFPESDDTVFNRDYDRYYGTLDLHDLPKGFNFSVTGSFYNGKGKASDVFDLSGEISYDWTKQLCTTLGGYWGIYRFDLRGLRYPWTDPRDYYQIVPGTQIYGINRWRFQGLECEDQTQSWFIRQTYEPTRWAKLDLQYEFEHARTGRYHTFSAGFRFDF